MLGKVLGKPGIVFQLGVSFRGVHYLESLTLSRGDMSQQTMKAVMLSGSLNERRTN